MSTNDDQHQIGLIGLGEMGLPMAGRLAAAGFQATVCDALPQRQAEAIAAGLRWAERPSQTLGDDTEAVIVMVRTLPQVQEVLFGEGGCLQDTARQPGQRPLDVIVMSTIDPGSMRAISRRAAEVGAILIDAPVSGGRKGAVEGTLAIMASGPADALARVNPLLQALGSHIAHVGPEAGHGQAVKLANQAMMAAAMAGTVEGIEIAKRYGVDEQVALEVIAHGTGGGWVVRNWDWMRSLWEDYEPGNALDVLYKDMKALLEVAGADWQPLPVAAASFQRLLEHWGTQPPVRRAHGPDA